MSPRWMAVSVLLFGCAEGGNTGAPTPRCEAGARCATLPDAGLDAPVDSGPLPCPANRDNEPVILAERLGYPSEVVAPAAAMDPALVTESAAEGTRVTVVDVAQCETLSSVELQGTQRDLVAAGRELIWIDGQTVRVRAIGSDVERAVTLQHPGVDLHLDAAWLYVLTAEPGDDGVMATWIERVGRDRLSDEQIQSEPWIRVQFDPRTRWFDARLTGSAARLIVGFWSTDLDETQGPTLRIDPETGAQDVLAPNDSSYGMFALGSKTYQQRGSDLLAYEDTQEPVTLRSDLEGLQLVGVIAGHAVARAPSAQLLLALPFDGSARVQIADEQAPFAGVATSGDDVYWVNWARRLMTVHGVPQ